MTNWIYCTSHVPRCDECACAEMLRLKELMLTGEVKRRNERNCLYIHLILFIIFEFILDEYSLWYRKNCVASFFHLTLKTIRDVTVLQNWHNAQCKPWNVLWNKHNSQCKPWSLSTSLRRAFPWPQPKFQWDCHELQLTSPARRFRDSIPSLKYQNRGNWMKTSIKNSSP